VKRLIKIVALLATFVLVMAACGDDDTADTTAATTAATTATTSAAAATTQAPVTTEAPSTAGQGGHLLILQWQAVSLANPLISNGTKDLLAGSLVVEPLIDFAPSGDPVARLVKEVPSVTNGGISADLMSVTFNLLEGVLWSDGARSRQTTSCSRMSIARMTHLAVPLIRRLPWSPSRRLTILRFW